MRGSGEADVDTGTAGLSKQTWSGATTTSAPPSTLTSASTVASEASFKSSGDPLNTCPPPPAMINAGMPYCLEEFETTGAGPSAAQAALDYTGQNVPTSKTPTVALSTNTTPSRREHQHHRCFWRMPVHDRNGQHQLLQRRLQLLVRTAPVIRLPSP